MEAIPTTPSVPVVPSSVQPAPAVETAGFFHTINAKVVQFFSSLPTYVSDILIFGPLGMLFGFLAKIMGRYFVFAVLVAIIAGWVAVHYGVITFDEEKLKALLGLSPTITFSDVIAMLFMWMKEHVAACIAMIIGFIIGWKLGK